MRLIWDMDGGERAKQILKYILFCSYNLCISFGDYYTHLFANTLPGIYTNEICMQTWKGWDRWGRGHPTLGKDHQTKSDGEVKSSAYNYSVQLHIILTFAYEGQGDN